MMRPPTTIADTDALAISPSSRRRWSRGLVAILGVALVLGLAASWLVVPYTLDGPALLRGAGDTVKTERVTYASALARALARFADGPGEADVDVLWAVPEYFAAAGAGIAVHGDDSHVFIVTETTHTRSLPSKPPEAALYVDGARVAGASTVEGPSDVDHHRTTIVRLPRKVADGSPTIPAGDHLVELRLSNMWAGAAPSQKSVSWNVPLALPERTSAAQAPALMLALAAGLLASVLTPCLLQMTLIFLTTLAGLGGEAARGRAGRDIPLLAAGFVAGFAALYTTAGALVGYFGNSAQVLFAEIGWPVSVAAAGVILVLAVWTAYRAQMPVLCRLPLPAGARGLDRSGFIRAALLSAAVALGCLTCFGGAIIGTLLVYVGVLGDATTGAAVMGMFSLGIGVPFLVSALAFSRLEPLIEVVGKYRPTLAYLNVAVMVAYAFILLTDNFHVVSNAIYPLLGL